MGNECHVGLDDRPVICFDLKGLSKCKPRGYQIELLLQALQRNMVIFLPTGAGKTLVATMLVKRMHQLNPHKKAVFVVHRVPLLYQQGDYLREQTGLQVAALCGEMMLSREAMDRQMREREVLVATAGLLLNVLAEGRLCLHDVSVVVFDEAHHASGAHPYM
eukprot:jgi/Mesvir1/8971/Mv14194-RA.1